MGGELILKLYILLIVNLFMQEYILCQMNEFKLACVLLCYIMLYYVIPCYTMLYYVMLYRQTISCLSAWSFYRYHKRVSKGVC